MLGDTRNRLEKVVARELELWNQKSEAVGKLATTEREAGSALVDGNADQQIAVAVTLKTKIAALDLAIRTLRAGRGAAIAEQNAEDARKLRNDISPQRKESQLLEERSSKLLKQLSDLQAVAYSESILFLESYGPNMFHRPKIDVLRTEVAETEKRATETENRPVPHRGEVDIEDATDDAQIIRAVLMHRSEAPTAEAVATWLARVAQDHRLNSPGFGDRRRRVRIQWHDGQIDERESYVFVASLAKPGVSEGRFDIPSGTFRTIDRSNTSRPAEAAA